MALGRIDEAHPEVSSRVRWTLSRNFVTNFVTRRVRRGNEFRNATRKRGNFVTLFVTPSISALARRTIGIVARAAAAARWGIPQIPKRFDRRSDDFLCGAATSERFDHRVNQKWGVSSAIPHVSPRAGTRSSAKLRYAGLKNGFWTAAAGASSATLRCGCHCHTSPLSSGTERTSGGRIGVPGEARTVVKATWTPADSTTTIGVGSEWTTYVAMSYLAEALR
jgi:hypothetical protein